MGDGNDMMVRKSDQVQASCIGCQRGYQNVVDMGRRGGGAASRSGAQVSCRATGMGVLNNNLVRNGGMLPNAGASMRD
jgi:hypothetical protein